MFHAMQNKQRALGGLFRNPHFTGKAGEACLAPTPALGKNVCAPESIITVRAGIYNWQTGERFYSEDQATEWSVITGIVIPS